MNTLLCVGVLFFFQESRQVSSTLQQDPIQGLILYVNIFKFNSYQDWRISPHKSSLIFKAIVSLFF